MDGNLLKNGINNLKTNKMKCLLNMLFFRYDVNNVDTVFTTLLSLIIWLGIIIIIVSLKIF